MSKDDQIIMAVPRDILFGDDYFEGFRPHSEVDYETRVVNNYFFGRRGDLEQDPRHKQPIAYCLIVNPSTRQVFAFQRARKDTAYDETRLKGKWSWGIGGHIEETDTGDGNNPIHASMTREALQEEVNIQGSTIPKVLGYINDDSDANDGVNKDHFGILYLIETDATTVTPKGAEIANGRLRNLAELEEICADPEYDVETWSEIALKALKQYLS